RLKDAGVEASVGTTGDSYDNAMAETIIGLFKTEVIHARGPWRSLDAVEYATLEWVEWFNNRRLLVGILRGEWDHLPLGIRNLANQSFLGELMERRPDGRSGNTELLRECHFGQPLT